ncbi:TolC family protein [Novosphingobium sp. G106]|uniref:TolC family protein n=1 Tax=Novosphingobium sp. G106 TaxID=2849500 RepID=UPI001C2D6F91|nr:TolC family protein [Novosphingobium sp. G106]MBV1692736.1 TolC family protein [Novosphingobium sp. G106]
MAVASTYIQLRTADARLDILKRTLGARSDTLRLIRRRAEAGYGSQLDFAQAEAEYEATAQAILPVELAIARLENGLSIRLSRAPAPIARGKSLDEITLPVVPVQLSAATLRRRPDLAASEQQIVAADHALDVACAAFMPNTACRRQAASSLPRCSRTIRCPSIRWVAASLRPSSTAAVSRRKPMAPPHVGDQAAFAYRRAALTAFREVEDGMASIQRLGGTGSSALAAARCARPYTVARLSAI